MSQRIAHSQVEAVANALIGAAIAQGVLWLYSMPLTEAFSLNAVMIFVSYARAFALRRVFARIG